MASQTVTVAVTATATKVALINSVNHTVRNSGAQTIYYRASADVAGFAGTAQQLELICDGWIAPGESVELGGDEDSVVLVAATGLTSTAACRAGKHRPAQAQSSDVAAVAAAIVGTGLPIPLAVADPGNDDWSAALDPNPIDRPCTRLRMFVGNSGMQLSLDGGTTYVSLPQNTGDDIGIAISSGADVRIKRLTAGTAMTSIIVEVR